ncbi:MAG: hypothetical protein AB1726_00625 [Planctomycetota bacterium]
MASEQEALLRRHFMDPDFWRPRLERLERAPRQLVLLPRPENGRSGTQLLELRLLAHDGERLLALLARQSFARTGCRIRLRPAPVVEAAAVDWPAVGAGLTDVIFAFPPLRRLEDQVLDVLRVAHAACSVESVECSSVELDRRSAGPAHDALCIAEMIRARGWV